MQTISCVSFGDPEEEGLLEEVRELGCSESQEAGGSGWDEGSERVQRRIQRTGGGGPEHDLRFLTSWAEPQRQDRKMRRSVES